jgi:hypothetical protein
VQRSLPSPLGRRRLAVDARGDRRKDVEAAVRQGRRAEDPADAALAAVYAADLLRRFGERGGLLPFSRDFALAAAVAGVLALVTDTSWTARVGMLLVILAVLVIAELGVDAFLARRRANAARAERENLALMLDYVARHSGATPAERGPRALMPGPPVSRD